VLSKWTSVINFCFYMFCFLITRHHCVSMTDVAVTATKLPMLSDRQCVSVSWADVYRPTVLNCTDDRPYISLRHLVISAAVENASQFHTTDTTNRPVLGYAAAATTLTTA